MPQTTPHEYQRQLRNLFATLRTLVRQSVSSRDSVEDFSAHLEGRIGCLARAHDLLMLAPPEGVDLHALICEELLAQAVPEELFELTGPDIRISRESTAPLALTLHELAINATTHGALSRNGPNSHSTHRTQPRMQIAWRTLREADSEWLQIVWSEPGMAFADDVPPRKGFGFELLERMLPHELGARSSLQFTRDSLRVELLIPEAAAARNWQPAHAD